MQLRNLDTRRGIPQAGACRRARLLPRLIARAAVVVLAWTLPVVGNMQAQKSSPTEYEVKAAYLYNFGRFVEWPNQATAAGGRPFAVCVLGQDPFGQALDAALAGKTSMALGQQQRESRSPKRR